MPILYYLDYCSYLLVLRLNTLYGDSSIFKIVLVIRTYATPYKVSDKLVYVFIKTGWQFDRNYIKFINQFGKN